MALGQQLNDREDAHVLAFAAPAARHARRVASGRAGAVASGVTCVAPKNSSDKFAYEACLWTRDPALAKIAATMDRELLPGRVERANLSTFGEFTVDDKPPGLPDFSSARPGACFACSGDGGLPSYRRRRGVYCIGAPVFTQLPDLSSSHGAFASVR